MGEYVAQQNIDGRRTTKRREILTAEAMGRKLLGVIVYGRNCRIGGRLNIDDLVEASEVGDWKMPDFRMAWNLCGFAGVAHRHGPYAYAHHGGVSGGLTIQPLCLSRVSLVVSRMARASRLGRR